MIEALLVLLVALAIATLVVRDMLVMVILASVFSLMACLIYYVLHAPDVALTEAAVGTGVGTVVFVWIVRKTVRKDET
jgi:uncharacterized MnhB-related membrane protein